MTGYTGFRPLQQTFGAVEGVEGLGRPVPAKLSPSFAQLSVIFLQTAAAPVNERSLALVGNTGVNPSQQTVGAVEGLLVGEILSFLKLAPSFPHAIHFERKGQPLESTP